MLPENGIFFGVIGRIHIKILHNNVVILKIINRQHISIIFSLRYFSWYAQNKPSEVSFSYEHCDAAF